MKKIVALVLAMVMVLGLATTAFAAKAGYGFEAAKGDSGNWNFVVTQDDPEDAKDSTFATYEIEAFAKKFIKSENPVWDNDAATLTDVKAGEDFTVYYGEYDSFVKVDDKNADLVIIDGKTISYFAAVTAKEVKWDAKAVKVTLPGYPGDAGDVKCNTLYNDGPAPGTFYWEAEDEVLYEAVANGSVCLNVDGVAVYAEEASTTYVGHDLIVNWANREANYETPNGVQHLNPSIYPTKVYCQFCKAEFAFVYGDETDALAAFGAGNYTKVADNGDADVYIETIYPAIPGVTATAPSAPAAGETVESAKTFDAGIAMYVGMSVMAAAGSAVVLKKKD